MLPSWLQSGVQASLRRLGLNVTRAENTLDRKRARLLVRQRTDLVLDVGANDGEYGNVIRAHGYRGRIVSFEPLAQPAAALAARAASDPAWQVHRVALGDTDGTATIRVSQNINSSSLLPVTTTSTRAAPESAHAHDEDVTIRRLDTLRAEVIGAAERIHLKMDVQGSEGAVLSGSAASLAGVVSIEAEVSLVSLYEGQPLAGELLTDLAARGYLPVWIERGFTDPGSGHMLQADVLLLREDRL